jgi:hypothetical protein
MSIRRRLRALVRPDRADAGVALPAVIGIAIVMLIMVAGSLSAVTGGVLRTNTDENVKGAMSAAYAGVAEYQSRLSNDSTYYKFGNPAAAFSSTSSASLSLPTSPNVNPAFGNTTTGTWATIPDPITGADSGASFRYQVDNSDYATKGIVRLQSTGRVGSVTATLVADLRQTGFIDFLYFTDFETGDPVLNATYKNQVDANGNNVCARYAYATSPARPSGCGTIQFAAADTLSGPVHSNDRLTICGTTFSNTVTSAAPAASLYTVPSGCAQPKFTAVPAAHRDQLPMPPTNSQMKKETRSDLPTDVPNPGCLYTGPTTITFKMVSGVGKMTINSPYTLHTEPTATGNGPDPDKCGKPSDLASKAGATVNVLDLNLMYVQSVPTTTGDPNYWASNSTPSNLSCLSSTQSSQYSGGFKLANGTQYPSTGELLPGSSTSDTPAYSCRNGDVYVGGTLSGRTTIAADNYVYATSDIVYNDASADVLGLVGQNGVWVWNPVVCSTTITFSNGNPNCSGGTWKYGNSDSTPEIDAAILSVAHTFMVQNYDGSDANLGARGTLTVKGAIAQRFRGPVATSSSGTIVTGFQKNYAYDSRFKNTAPPKFLTPVSTTYGVTQFSGTAAAYNAAGAPQ